MSRRQAFTLIELLVVIAIIAVLYSGSTIILFKKALPMNLSRPSVELS
jgi:prepilin-type N-terminal cleavage/methylation domain-containing protein